MADLTGNLGGQQIDARIPDFALESTAQEMVTALNKMAGIEKKEFKDHFKKIDILEITNVNFKFPLLCLKEILLKNEEI